MKSYKMYVFGREVCFFSKSDGEVIYDALPEASVVISQREGCDAYVDYSSSGISEACGAALAAAFLVLNRGLPLSELKIATNGGKYEIFNTGGGVFRIKVPKIRLLERKCVELCGADASVSELEYGGKVRTLLVERSEGFDPDVLPLLSYGDLAALRCLLAVHPSSNAQMWAYTDFAINPPTPLELFFLGAYLCKACGINEGNIRLGDLCCPFSIVDGECTLSLKIKI